MTDYLYRLVLDVTVTADSKEDADEIAEKKSPNLTYVISDLEQKKNEIEKQVKNLLAALTDEVVVMANIVCDFDQETIASVKYETPIEDSDTGLLLSQNILKESLQ